MKTACLLLIYFDLQRPLLVCLIQYTILFTSTQYIILFTFNTEKEVEKNKFTPNGKFKTEVIQISIYIVHQVCYFQAFKYRYYCVHFKLFCLALNFNESVILLRFVWHLFHILRGIFYLARVDQVRLVVQLN